MHLADEIALRDDQAFSSLAAEAAAEEVIDISAMHIRIYMCVSTKNSGIGEDRVAVGSVSGGLCSGNRTNNS